VRTDDRHGDRRERGEQDGDEHDVLALANQLCFALYSTHRALTRAYAPLLKPLGVTYPQYLALLALWERDSRAVTELGERLDLETGTLTPLLKRLERDGLVERKRDAGDQRVVRIVLTRAGRQLEAKARDVPERILEQAGFDIRKPRSMVALAKLRGDLHKIAMGLGQSFEPPS
jgi:MarR family transcriptional regulator, organic hydroperoxide resistance regulator